jgi:serine/threonine protein kinase
LTGQRQRRIRELFEAACDRPAEEQGAYVFAESGGDPEMVDAVSRLLSARNRADGLLDTPAARIQPLPAAGPRVGSVIGSYKILRELGSGGMGIVYQVVRADEVFHRVSALKVVRPEFAGASLLARFRKERQILAQLDHPNIARIVDGGSTQAGLPYFVMDFVDGQPINVFCSQNLLTVIQRLAIFRQVCAAAQYLHDNRIVHSDLKPSNILVGADGIVKILDFGIASVLWPTGSSQNVQPPLPLMTPGYASPEQLRGGDIGPVSDVYSLGVVLFELLTGTRPYPSDGLRAADLLTAIETTPPRPPSSAATARAAAFPGEWAAVQKSIRGELDSIVLRAIHKNPAARYQSGSSLSNDIENYLHGLPVSAVDGNWLYRGRKFVHRNLKTVLTTAALLALAGLNLWQANEIQKREKLSRDHQNAVVRVQAQKMRDAENRGKTLAGMKASGHNPTRADLDSLRQAQLVEVNQLGEAYRTSFSESVRLWPGMTPARRNLLDQADIYLHRAEAIVADDQAAREQLALAWLWVAKIEGDPGVPNLHDRNSASASIREAERVIEMDDSPQAQRLLQSIKNTRNLIG